MLIVSLVLSTSHNHMDKEKLPSGQVQLMQGSNYPSEILISH